MSKSYCGSITYRQNLINTFYFTLLYKADNVHYISDDGVCEVLMCDFRLQLVSVLLMLLQTCLAERLQC